ncbi:hypothetical protein [Hymenobacter psychrotolerans]|uniref:hypothetical protein n=1 Tax=Hymenobacter psychrotolerans TaxID=344998 RepID=UPI000934AD8A|nr:hypothetical protein [Hymenobacter psychrotolerans]
MTFSECQDYIRELAVQHRTDDSEHDVLELSAFQTILCFALHEGWQADINIVQKVLHGSDWNTNEEDDEHTTWHYMYLLLDEFEAQNGDKLLPVQTAELYNFWQTEFWGNSDTD